MMRLAKALADTPEHHFAISDILLDMRFLPGGRIQKDIGSPFATTAFNCFVSGTIHDSMSDIMAKLSEAAETMRRGGGIGYDFSKLRPRGYYIRTLGAKASGPVSFMDIFDAMCGTIQSAGHRRGAQMGVLRVDHPDILEFVHAKNNPQKLTKFNVSVAITDDFMYALAKDKEYNVSYEGKVHNRLPAKYVWDAIMRNTWNYAEPGVLFIDRINEMNPLGYCERIAATNPCGEVPLPPYGACLLGSFNMVKYLVKDEDGAWDIDFPKFAADIPPVVRAMDNVIDRTIYPLVQQEADERNKRRMGLGVTGVANALEICGYRYGTTGYLAIQDEVLETLRDCAYLASIDLASEKGSFPLFNSESWLGSGFGKRLPKAIQTAISQDGLRNGCLLSIAPTGTISLCADNVSSGIEPPFSLEYTRTIQEFDGTIEHYMTDYAFREYGVRSKTADGCTVKEHVDVLCHAQKYIDHAVSKTCNVGESVSFDEFKNIYINAYDGGAKGVTTFRAAGLRTGILKSCEVDPDTGLATCDL